MGIAHLALKKIGGRCPPYETGMRTDPQFSWLTAHIRIRSIPQASRREPPESSMSPQDPTQGSATFRDGESPTEILPTNPAPSFDSLRTRPPSDPFATRCEPGDSTDSYATAHPDSIPTTPRDIPADAFPGYELLEEIGRGGMAIVYKARQEGLNRLVAFKMILGGHRAGPKDLIRFLVEAEAVASIKHPNVVQVHEYGEADNRPFLAMEYLPGGTLADRLKTEGRIAPKPAAELVAKLARAVQAAHDQEIVHRDLKPSNVLFDAQGEPKVTDFGLAKRTTGIDQTHTQAVMGTPAYMSPEQAQGKSKFVGPQADVYALGVILYECLSGKRPFFHEETLVLLARVMMDDPEPPSRHVPGLPRDLELIALKCLAKEPEVRYQTAAALAEDLAHFTAGEPVSVRAASTIERTLKWARRKPTQAAAYALSLAVVVLLAFGASLAFLWWQAEGARATAEIAKENAETARKRELNERKNAETARDGEKRARTIAESARDAETKARTIAESARDGEKKARAEVEDAQEKLARVEYGKTMQMAYEEWRDNNRTRSLALLEGTRADLRGWEWKYIQHLWHGELLELKGHTGSVTSASWSPDGSRIATAGDKTARVWDARSGAEILTLKGHAAGVNSVSWSPDGLRIATASQDRTVRVWDAGSGTEIHTLKGQAKEWRSVSWSPDGLRLAISGISGIDTATRIWNAQNGTEVLAIKNDGRTELSTVSWSPDGSRIAVGMHVWDSRTGDEALSLKGFGVVWSVSWSPDGSRLATAEHDGTARVWDARTGSELLVLRGHIDAVTSVSWNRDGSQLATASRDKTARVWDARSGTEVLRITGNSDMVNSVSWSPNGSFIVTASNETACVWDARTGTEALVLKGHTEGVTSVSWSPDGSRIATAGYDRKGIVWDARTGSEKLKLYGKSYQGGVAQVSWSPDGSRLATANFDGTAGVWNARTGESVHIFRHNADEVNSVSWSPDGSRLATASSDKTLRVWDTRTGDQPLTIKCSIGAFSVSWSPDGSLLTAGDPLPVIWDARTGVEILKLKGFGIVSAVSWSPDGCRIAAAGMGETASVWDTRSGVEILTLKGHTEEVKSVSWSPDGLRIATASCDKTVRVWDSRTGVELLTLKGHTKSVDWVSWSPDGSRIATASADKTARVWDARNVADLRAAGR